MVLKILVILVLVMVVLLMVVLLYGVRVIFDVVIKIKLYHPLYLLSPQAQQGSLEIVEKLLSYGADGKFQNISGKDSLMLACFAGKFLSGLDCMEKITKPLQKQHCNKMSCRAKSIDDAIITGSYLD